MVSNGKGYIKFPINEPAKGLKKSQLRHNGVEFLYVSETYYDTILYRVDHIHEQPYSAKSFNGKARAPSEKAISRPCLKPSSANKNCGARFKSLFRILSIGYKRQILVCAALNFSPDCPHPTAKFALPKQKFARFRSIIEP